uniref:Uncharacterized protein n=1 Tax=Callorhinchus milii TaxID=7868 RepID=A0A4W3GHA0_CALMI
PACVLLAGRAGLRPVPGKLEAIEGCVQALLHEQLQPRVWEQLGQVYESEQELEDAIKCYQNAARYSTSYGYSDLTSRINRLQQAHVWNLHSAPPQSRQRILPALQEVWTVLQQVSFPHPPGLGLSPPPLKGGGEGDRGVWERGIEGRGRGG